MNLEEVKRVMPVLMRNNVVPFLWGQQGVGKTQCVRQVAKELGIGFRHLHLATQEVGDLVGLLVHTEEGNVKHSRPEWFPTEGSGIVFLDEFNRAHPDVLQAMFSFITDKTIHTHRLPEGWRIVVAGNYQSNAFNVTDTSDAAMMSRFCHLDFTPSKEEFVLYAENNGAESVADFIRTHSECLEVNHKERLNTSLITPDRRAWLDMIARLEKEDLEDGSRYEVYAGIVGPTAAANFLTFKKKATERLSGKDILNKYSSVKKRVMEAAGHEGTRFDLLNSAVEEIFSSLPGTELSDKQMGNFKQFLLDVPMEMSLKICKKLHEIIWKQKNQILNDPKFVEVFKNTKLRKVG